MEFIKLIAVFSLLSLIPGQILRIPPSSTVGAITMSDISVLFLDSLFLVYFLGVKKSLKFPAQIALPFFAFITWSIAATILALRAFTQTQVLISALFVFRFFLYFFLVFVSFNLVSKEKIEGWVKLILAIGMLYILIGLLQFILIPDLTFLTPFGWDPHQRRIASTLIDPNFSGYIFVLIFSIAISYFLFLKNNLKKYYFAISVISFVATVLTFSRSSYLAFLTSVAAIGLIKSRKLLSISLIAVVIIFIAFSPVKDRVIGALTFDDTAKARVESWQNALTIISDNLYFGVGFNAYRFAQAKYSFFSTDNPLGGHSGGGVDSSLLLVTATTGLVGISFFVLLIALVMKSLAKNVTKSPLKLALLGSFIALLIHSVFVNSLFFPQIMLLFFFLLGLSLKHDS